MIENGFFYAVYENCLKVYTSQIFPELEMAVDFFLNEDAPVHYAKETFTRSVMGSYLKNDFAKSRHENRPIITVSFLETHPSVIPVSRWEKACGQKFKKNEEANA